MSTKSHGRLSPLQGITGDVRFAVRMLAKDLTFTLAVVVAMAISIGLATTVFSIINGMHLRAVPFEKPRQVVGVRGHDGAGRLRMPDWELFKAWQGNAADMVCLAAARDGSMNLADDDRLPDRVSGTFITSNGFDLLGVQPVLGRKFIAEDDRPGAAPVILLGHMVWTNRYGSDPSIIGRSIRVNGAAVTVIGVMPVGFKFPVQSDAWQPMAMLPALSAPSGQGPFVTVFGRLQDRVTDEQASAVLTGISSSSALTPSHKEFRATVVPINELYFGSDGYELPVLMSAAAVVMLLIVSANVAVLLLSRAAARSREIATRTALGAGRGRIVRQLAVEHLLLAVGGGAAGAGLAVGGVAVFSRQLSYLTLPYWTRFALDGRSLGFIAAASLACALLFGLAPIVRLSRTRIGVLQECEPSGTPSRLTRRWTSALLGGQLALTMILLSAAALLIHSATILNRADAVVDGSRIWVTRVALPATDYPTESERRVFFQRLNADLIALSGSVSASLTTSAPFSGGASRLLAMQAEQAEDRELPRVTVVSAGDRYFETLGLGLLAGRTFSETETTTGDAVIVNERFVTQFSPAQDPIGRRLRLFDEFNRNAPPITATIVGIAPTVRQRPMTEALPVVFRPFLASSPASATILVQPVGESPGVSTSALREVLSRLDPELPLFGLQSLDQISRSSRWVQQLMSTLLTSFAVVALTLSIFGVYSVTSYNAQQRTREIGMRMALGAKVSQIAILFLRATAAQLALGLAIGAVGAVGISGAINSLLVGTRPANRFMVAGIATGVIVVSVAAALVPALRAARLSPVDALRNR